jgi:predicted amidohydrolase
MRAGFLQFEPRPASGSYNLRIIQRILEGQEFDLLVLPELCNTGYLLGSRENAMRLAEAVPDGPMVSGLMELAARHKGWIAAGVAEREGDRVFNSAVLVGPSGLVHRHRKVHLPPYESAIFDRGEGFETARAGAASVGVALCSDTWMPEACRKLAMQGAEILLSPASSAVSWTGDLARLRALENVVYVISSNRIGIEEAGGVTAIFRGGSQVVDCDGQVLYQAGKEECVVTVEIDPARARSKANVACDDLTRELEFYRGTRRPAAN